MTYLKKLVLYFKKAKQLIHSKFDMDKTMFRF